MTRVDVRQVAETRSRTVLVLRLNGRPRDPIDGRHRKVLVYYAADLSPRVLAGLLREAADEIDGAAGDAT